MVGGGTVSGGGGAADGGGGGGGGGASLDWDAEGGVPQTVLKHGYSSHVAALLASDCTDNGENTEYDHVTDHVNAVGMAAALFGAINITLCLTSLERSAALGENCATCLTGDVLRFTAGAYHLILGVATLGMMRALIMSIALVAEYSAHVKTETETLQFILINDITEPALWFQKALYLCFPAYTCGVFAVSGWVVGSCFAVLTLYSLGSTKAWYTRLHTNTIKQLSDKVKVHTGKVWQEIPQNWKPDKVREALTQQAKML